MRRPRMKAEGAGYYHCMSRIIERRAILGEAEKETLLRLMRELAGFGGLEVLTYCFMSNHFHILVHVPERRDVTDEEFLRRVAFIRRGGELKALGRELRARRQRGQAQAAEALKARFTYRMYDLSEFFKALKQRFSQAYNARVERCGPLWEQRFKSLLVERAESALLTVAAYIELNAVRGGCVGDPKDYRYSGYGEALGGGREAREGLRRVLEAARGRRFAWGQAKCAYRQRLYVQGQQRGLSPEGRPIRPGFTAEQVRAVLEAGGRLPMHEVLRCRVRYFSDGLALGGREFVEGVFARYRGHFGPRRHSGARPMRCGEWGALCTLRDLRLAPVSRV